MANQPTLHERISAHPGMAHSEWVACNPGAKAHEIELMRKRFERIGQIILDDLNRHRSRPRTRTHYPIPGEPEYLAQEAVRNAWKSQDQPPLVCAT